MEAAPRPARKKWKRDAIKTARPRSWGIWKTRNSSIHKKTNSTTLTTLRKKSRIVRELHNEHGTDGMRREERKNEKCKRKPLKSGPVTYLAILRSLSYAAPYRDGSVSCVIFFFYYLVVFVVVAAVSISSYFKTAANSQHVFCLVLPFLHTHALNPLSPPIHAYLLAQV